MAFANITNATTQAVLWSGIAYNMTVENVPRPQIQAPSDAIVRLTSSAICGSDLHMYHGVYGGTEVPWIMGHEGIGVIAEAGESVTSLSVGDRVVIPDQPSRGSIDFGPPTSIVSFGGGLPDYGGTQAQYVRVPFADESLWPIPANTSTSLDSTPNEIDYLFTSDIFATAWTAVTWSGFEAGDSIAVFGAGPVGLLAAYSSTLRGASRVYIVDHEPSRLELAASIGAIPVNFAENDPVQFIMSRESDGVTRAVDCVGFEAVNRNMTIDPHIIATQMVSVVSSHGGIGTIGVFGASQPGDPGAPRGGAVNDTMVPFPIASFFNKGLSWRAGIVDPKEIAFELVSLISSGKASPSFIVSAEIGIEEAPEYYQRFDHHQETKVVIRF